MGYRNLNTQSEIKRSPQSFQPLVLDIKTDYFSLCPAPIEFEIEVVSGNPLAHYYRWKLIEGATGVFKPNARTLFATFDPLGNKERRVVELTIDPGTEYEQVYTLTLFDRAASWSDAHVMVAASKFPFINQPELACDHIDMNFNVSIPLFEEDSTTINFDSYGNIIFVNEDVVKVELFEYPSMNLVHTFVYPDSLIYTVDTSQKYYARTWYYFKNIGWMWAWAFVELSNIYTLPLTAQVVNDRAYPNIYDGESAITQILGSGTARIINDDNVHPNIYDGVAHRQVFGRFWVPPSEPNPPTFNGIDSKKQPAANNSLRGQACSSGSAIVKLLDINAGTVG